MDKEHYVKALRQIDRQRDLDDSARLINKFETKMGHELGGAELINGNSFKWSGFVIYYDPLDYGFYTYVAPRGWRFWVHRKGVNSPSALANVLETEKPA